MDCREVCSYTEYLKSHAFDDASRKTALDTFSRLFLKERGKNAFLIAESMYAECMKTLAFDYGLKARPWSFSRDRFEREGER